MKPKPQTRKVRKALQNPDPIAALGHEEYIFAFHLALGKDANAACRKAYPHWTKESVRANAYALRHRPDILRATQALQAEFAKAKKDGIIASMEEIMIMLSQGMRTTLEELDTDNVHCIKKKITQNSAGTTIELVKDSPRQYAETMAKIMGLKVGMMGLGVTENDLLGSLRQPGLPSASPKVYDLEEEDEE